jgi:hypothetical protein
LGSSWCDDNIIIKQQRERERERERERGEDRRGGTEKQREREGII